MAAKWFSLVGIGSFSVRIEIGNVFGDADCVQNVLELPATILHRLCALMLDEDRLED
jgi:hypothetical protein